MPPDRPFSCESSITQIYTAQIKCCDAADMCNVEDLPTLAPSPFILGGINDNGVGGMGSYNKNVVSGCVSWKWLHYVT